jgi:hypothetical protein
MKEHVAAAVFISYVLRQPSVYAGTSVPAHFKRCHHKIVMLMYVNVAFDAVQSGSIEMGTAGHS